MIVACIREVELKRLYSYEQARLFEVDCFSILAYFLKFVNEATIESNMKNSENAG